MYTNSFIAALVVRFSGCGQGFVPMEGQASGFWGGMVEQGCDIPLWQYSFGFAVALVWLVYSWGTLMTLVISVLAGIPSRFLLNCIQFPVTMARGSHLFPFRTQQLSLFAPIVLGW